MKMTLFMGTINLIFIAIFVGLLVLIARVLLKYIKSKDVRQEKSEVIRSFG